MRKFLKSGIILAVSVLIVFLVLLNISTFFKYEDEKHSNKEIKEILNDYDGVSFIKYKPTLFSIYNRGGFEANNNIDNLIYEKEPDVKEIEKIINGTKVQKIITLKITDAGKSIRNLSCQIEMKNYWDSMNDCLSLFSRITKERLGYLKQLELNNIHKQISYNFSGTDKSFWDIKIADNRYYELRFSEIHRMRIKESYGIELPEKIYGILTEEQFKNIENLNIEKITTDDDEGLRELLDIFPFISFSYRYKDVTDTGNMK